MRVALLLLIAAGAGCAPSPPPSPLPDGAQVVVLAGQSNMAGIFAPEPADTAAAPRVWMFDDDAGWVPAREPVHRTGGVGPGLAFGRALAAETAPVGLIPCAVGGSSLAQWTSGRWRRRPPFRVRPYADACAARVRRATGGAPVAALLWHQGETEALLGRTDYAATAGALLADLARRTRARCVLGGELVAVDTPGAAAVRAAQRALFGPGLVSAADLPLAADGIHLSPASARTLGRRYAAAVRAGACAPIP